MSLLLFIRLTILGILVFSTGIDSQEIDYLEQLKNKIPSIYSSLQGDITFVYSSGELESGKIYYQYPDKLRVKLSSGRLILTNGKFLWMCRPSKLICFKQEVDKSLSSGGILGLLKSYEGKKEGDHYSFTKKYPEGDRTIMITTADKMLKTVNFKSSNNRWTVSFSNLTFGANLKSSLFYYKDSNTQIIENPLNN